MRRWQKFVSAVGASRLLSALGGTFVVSAILQANRHVATSGPPWEGLVDFVLFAGPGAVLLFCAYRLPRTDRHPDVYPRVVGWCLGGMVLMVAIVGLLVLDPGGSVTRPMRAAGIAAGLGAVGGVGVGWNETRAFERAAEAEARLRELERYETIVERVTDGVIVVDADASIRAVNEALVGMTGYPRERLVGAPASLILPDSLDADVDDVQASLETGTGTEQVETMIQPANAEPIPSVTHFAPLTLEDGSTGRVGGIRDISDRVERERELEESERRYRTLVENVPNGAVTLFDEDLRGHHREAIQRYLQTGERTLDWDYLELPGLHERGHEVPLAISFSEFEQDCDRFFAGIIRAGERKLFGLVFGEE